MPFILYVHPNVGPISPMPIDLDAVHAVGETNPRHATEVVAAAIAAQVDKRFPQAQARNNVHAFEALVPHLNPLFFTYITGIAVRVPGSIIAPPLDGGNAKKLAELEQEVRNLTQKLTETQNALMQEQETHRKTYSEMARYRANAVRGASSEQVDRLSRRCSELEGQLRTLEAASKEAMGKAQEVAEEAERNLGKEQLRADKAEHERNAAVSGLNALREQVAGELKTLRDERDNAKGELNKCKYTWLKDKRIYDATLQEKERELRKLRQAQRPNQLEQISQPDHALKAPVRIRVVLPPNL